ncbi:Uncharacterised protein [Kingella potus]|uniref:Lipoprotein n=1 Tax=Kingella potus TaxID=265175 RepID=A0A377QZG7_9NEIS|nr:hypothetical protein [Kingella potus]STR00643.1 Uncharacterised protein [Kingella potus]
MKTLLSLCFVLALAACASRPSAGDSEIYGEIKTGVETVHTR